jgi:hypothetical protein
MVVLLPSLFVKCGTHFALLRAEYSKILFKASLNNYFYFCSPACRAKLEKPKNFLDPAAKRERPRFHRRNPMGGAGCDLMWGAGAVRAIKWWTFKADVV